jgi:hypothetical protein
LMAIVRIVPRAEESDNQIGFALVRFLIAIYQGLLVAGWTLFIFWLFSQKRTERTGL